MQKNPRTVEVPICFDHAVEKAAIDAKADLEQTAHNLLASFRARVVVAQTRHPDQDPAEVAQGVYEDDQATLDDLKDTVEAAEAALRDACQVFVFTSIGFKAWRALKAAHPSKNKDLIFDVDGLAPALLRDASVSPKLTAAAVEDILEGSDWSEGEVNLLLGAAIAVQG